jgi:hypothetical protein
MHEAQPEVTHLIREQGELSIHLISIWLGLAMEIIKDQACASTHARMNIKEATLLLPSARCS